MLVGDYAPAWWRLRPCPYWEASTIGVTAALCTVSILPWNALTGSARARQGIPRQDGHRTKGGCDPDGRGFPIRARPQPPPRRGVVADQHQGRRGLQACDRGAAS